MKFLVFNRFSIKLKLTSHEGWSHFYDIHIVECSFLNSFVRRKVLTIFFYSCYDMLFGVRQNKAYGFWQLLYRYLSLNWSLACHIKRNLIENHNSANKKISWRRLDALQKWSKKSWKGHSHEEFNSTGLSFKFLSASVQLEKGQSYLIKKLGNQFLETVKNLLRNKFLNYLIMQDNLQPRLGSLGRDYK